MDDALTRLSADKWFRFGRATADAYARNEEWLFRRVESIDFVDRRSVRRTVTVDFEIPRGMPFLDKRSAEGTVLVPIAVIQKWPPTMDFHLSDEGGNALSRYRGVTTRKLDFGLLMGMIDRVLGKRDPSNRVATFVHRQDRWRKRLESFPADKVDKALLADLAKIVENPEPEQEDVARATTDLERELKRARPFMPGSGSPEETKFADKLAKTVDLAGRLAGGSILWVAIPGPPGADRIVRFSYLGAHLDSRPEFPDEPRNLVRFLTRTAKRMAISCSWRHRTMVIPLLHTGRDTRYHLNVRAPAGSVEMQKVTALAMPSADGADKEAREPKALSVAALADLHRDVMDPPDEWVGPQSTGYFIYYGKPKQVITGIAGVDAGSHPRGNPTAEIIDRHAHIYLGETGAPSHRVILQLRLKAAREGLIRGCAIAAAAIAALMWVVYFNLEAAAKHAETTVVLLSLVPVILGYVVVRPEEQEFEHEHLRGVRLMALAAGCLPIAGALFFALTLWHPKGKNVEPDLPSIEPIWMWLAWGSTALAVLLAISYLQAAPARPRNRWWRRLTSRNRP